MTLFIYFLLLTCLNSTPCTSISSLYSWANHSVCLFFLVCFVNVLNINKCEFKNQCNCLWCLWYVYRWLMSFCFVVKPAGKVKGGGGGLGFWPLPHQHAHIRMKMFSFPCLLFYIVKMVFFIFIVLELESEINWKTRLDLMTERF